MTTPSPTTPTPMAPTAVTPTPATPRLEAPVGVIGVTHGCGLLTTLALARRGKNVRALTRSITRAKLSVEPKFGDKDAEKIEYVRLDVVKGEEVIGTAIDGCSAVVFAASATHQTPFGIGKSKEESPEMVDGKGLENVATACVAKGVKRLVILSTYDADRKWIVPNVMLDVLANSLVKWKKYGEAAVKRIFHEANTKLGEGETRWSYVIVRPSWLRDKEGQGPSQIFARGRVHIWTSSFIGRQDVAEILAESAVSNVINNATFNVTDRRGKPDGDSWVDKGEKKKIPNTWTQLLEQVESLETLDQKKKTK